jgi:hypothetical protein
MAEKSGGEKAAETASENHSQLVARILNHVAVSAWLPAALAGMLPLPPMRCEPERDSRLPNRFDVLTHRFDGRVR